MAPPLRASSGSALVVLLLVLAGFIGAILLFGGNLASSRKLGARVAGQAAYQSLHEALVRFVQVNKRLPCPANGAANPQTGAEEKVSDTACGAPAGVVPWAALGLPKSAATDSHGRLYSYRVHDGAAGFTRTGGLNLSNCLDSDAAVLYTLSGPLDSGSQLTCNATTHENTRSDFLESKGLSVNDRGVAKTKVAYALIGHGPTGLGAYTAADSPIAPVQLTLPHASSKEFLNAGSGGTYWILDPSDATVSPDDAAYYDDDVSYRLAGDLVAAAKIGGRPWPLFTTFSRVNATGSVTPLTGNVSTLVSSRKIAVTGGPVMVNAFATSSTRHISSMPVGIFYGIGAMTTSGGGGQLTTSNNEGLTFDFRVRRRILKITLGNFNIVSGNEERAQFTFQDDTTQVAQLTKQACASTGTSATFVIDLGSSPYNKEFTKVDVQALTRLGDSSSSNFVVTSIAACQYNDAACALPQQIGEVYNLCP